MHNNNNNKTLKIPATRMFRLRKRRSSGNVHFADGKVQKLYLHKSILKKDSCPKILRY